MKKNNEMKQIPRFKNEDEEREFWATHDFTDYIDSFERVELDLSELRPSTQTISLRVPTGLLDSLRELANKNDVPYQSLMKIFLAEKVEEALRKNK